MSKISRVQPVAIPLANATTPGKRAVAQTELDSEFGTVRGFYVIRNSGTDYLKIEIIDSAGTVVVADVNIKHLQVDTNIKIKDRFFIECPFVNKGKITINLTNFVNATALQDTDIIFLLDNHPLDHFHKEHTVKK